MSMSKYLYIIFEILMELELKLEWLEAVSKHLGGASPPDLFDTASSHSNFNSNCIKISKIGMTFGANIGAEIVALALALALACH